MSANSVRALPQNQQILAPMHTIVTTALQRHYSQMELIFWITLMCVCVCVCVYIYIYTHTHTHTSIAQKMYNMICVLKCYIFSADKRL